MAIIAASFTVETPTHEPVTDRLQVLSTSLTTDMNGSVKANLTGLDFSSSPFERAESAETGLILLGHAVFQIVHFGRAELNISDHRQNSCQCDDLN